MGLFNLLRTLATSGRKMEYLKTNFPEGWQLGEEEAEWHFRKLTESEASGKLEEEWGLLRLPQTSEEVRLYISKYALPIAIESLGTEIANRAGTPVAIAEDAMEAFGMAYAMKLSDLLDARKESRKEDAMKFFKKDLGKLYQQFKGKSNTNEVLIEKAKVLAPLLVGIVTENAESLFTELQKDRHRKVDKNRFGEVFYEMILFYLHSVDRFVFKSLEIEKRTTFMNALLVNVRDILARRRGTNNISVFHDAFVEAYNERQIEYGKYKKWLPENGEGAKDTLLWEFGKKIASILGSEKDIMVIMYVRTYFINAMKVLKLSDIFS